MYDNSEVIEEELHVEDVYQTQEQDQGMGQENSNLKQVHYELTDEETMSLKHSHVFKKVSDSQVGIQDEPQTPTQHSRQVLTMPIVSQKMNGMASSYQTEMTVQGHNLQHIQANQSEFKDLCQTIAENQRQLAQQSNNIDATLLEEKFSEVLKRIEGLDGNMKQCLQIEQEQKNSKAQEEKDQLMYKTLSNFGERLDSANNQIIEQLRDKVDSLQKELAEVKQQTEKGMEKGVQNVIDLAEMRFNQKLAEVEKQHQLEIQKLKQEFQQERAADQKAQAEEMAVAVSRQKQDVYMGSQNLSPKRNSTMDFSRAGESHRPTALNEAYYNQSHRTQQPPRPEIIRSSALESDRHSVKFAETHVPKELAFDSENKQKVKKQRPASAKPKASPSINIMIKRKGSRYQEADFYKNTARFITPQEKIKELDRINNSMKAQTISNGHFFDTFKNKKKGIKLFETCAGKITASSFILQQLQTQTDQLKPVSPVFEDMMSLPSPKQKKSRDKLKEVQQNAKTLNSIDTSAYLGQNQFFIARSQKVPGTAMTGSARIKKSLVRK